MSTSLDSLDSDVVSVMPAISNGDEKETSSASSRSELIPFENFALQISVLKAIEALGFEFCTPIQAASLAHTLNGHAVTGKAQTGTGKTAAFLITIINDLFSNPVLEKRFLAEPRDLIVAPTRELAIKIASDSALLNR